MTQLIRTILIGLLLSFLLVPVAAQQGGNGNQGNGATFTNNEFTGFSLGIPGGPICNSALTTIDDVNNWIRTSPNGVTTVHWVGQEARIFFYEQGLSGPEDVWEGMGHMTLNYRLAPTFEQIIWSVTGTVTHALTGETRSVSCHVNFSNGELRVFNLSLRNN